MAVGDIITASRYNLIQGRINTILGTGSGQDGYGQGLTSSSVSVGAVITAGDMNDLYTDIAAAHIHQQGSAPTTIAKGPSFRVVSSSKFESPSPSMPIIKYPILFNFLIVSERFFTLKYGCRSNAPEAVLASAPVSGAAWRAGAITARAPKTSAERRIAPTLCGSVTRSSSNKHFNY